MPDKPRVLLIDLSALFHPAWRANENGPVSVAFQATIGAVHRCLTTVPTDLVAVCCDGKGNWRKKLTREYKAHREKLPESFYGEFARVKERLTADGLLLWECDGFEADDVIATACLEAHLEGHPVTIATGDKDLAQLVCERADILNTRTWDPWTAEVVTAKFGVPPRQLGDWLALVGDSSDGVKGCPGCGPKRASELLTKFGKLDDLLAAVQAGTQVATPALQKALAENIEQIKLARQLVRLDDHAPIDLKQIYERRERTSLTETKESDVMSEENTPKDAPFEPSANVEALDEGAAAAVATMPATAELVTLEYSKALEPRSFRDTMTLARYLYDSRLYSKFKNPEAIAAIIMRGRELGYGAGTALEVFHVIEDRPYPFAYLIVAECRKDPDCDYLLCVESDEHHAVAETRHKRYDNPIRLTFTFEQAEKAGLPRTGARGPNGWLKNPEDMLVKSALSKLGRRVYSSRALGLVSLEEMGEA